MVDLIKGADIKDINTITDSLTNQLIDITALPAFEVWYYTSPTIIIKFSKESPQKIGYKDFIIDDANHYTAYLEGVETLTLKNGELCCDTYIATTNADLVKGTFTNYGTKRLGINIIDKPISSLVI
jgi:hypothetical protein